MADLVVDRDPTTQVTRAVPDWSSEDNALGPEAVIVQVWWSSGLR